MRRSKTTLSLLSLIFLPALLFSQAEKIDTFLLFYLGGQSNMDGYGYNHHLPESLNKTFEKVWIFHGNSVADDKPNGGLGVWAALRPGHGTGFSSDGKSNTISNRFGIELSFAKKLQEIYPGKKFAFIKYSRGGTSIDSLAGTYFGCWDPDYQGTTGINQYDHFLATMRNAMSDRDINNDGQPDYLLPQGILWMQGESDATINEAVANEYYPNLKRLMDLIRATLLVDDLPVVIGKISDSWNNTQGKVWKYGELVQYAQEKFARTDSHAAIVRSTRYYKYSDPWHYDSAGYIDLGEKFAEAIEELIKE